MSPHIYDNWDRLVAAVVKKQQLWELFHAHSRNSSISSSVSTDFSGRISLLRRSMEPILEINFNEILETENLDGPASVFQDEWIDRYESGVYMTLSAPRDGTVDVKRVQFRGIRFDAVQAKTWWLENQKKVYDTYNVQYGRRRFEKQEAEARWSGKKWKFYKFFNEITRVRQLSSKATSNKPNNLILEHGGRKEPILEINFTEILESANPEGTSGQFRDEWSDGYELGECEKWIERYEPGVYITLSTLQDGTVDVERVRFSRIRFDAEQVKTWWLENQKNVCERHKLSRPSSQV